MALVVDGGGLVNKGGSLGTGAACCCAGACCVCGLMPTVVGHDIAEFGTINDDVSFLYPHFQPISDANNVFVHEWEDAALALGYECVRLLESVITFIPDELSDGFWFVNNSQIQVRCCGIVDYGAEPTIIALPDFPDFFLPAQVSIYPCIQDEVTRWCYDDLSKTECDELCGVLHPSETCAGGACNPLP